MSDIYIPGVKSRFNSEKIIEDLMKLERVPKERAEKDIEKLETEKGYWQGINRRTNTLRTSARQLFSFQNPFSDRVVKSGDESILTGTAVRDAMEQTRSFVVKQAAQADRFLSAPLEENFKVDPGVYTFSVGKEEVSFEFRGGALKEFIDSLNRRGRNILSASLVNVKPGTTSLLIESKLTGEENRLNFSGAAAVLGDKTGMTGRVNDSRKDFTGDVITVKAGSAAEIPINFEIPSGNWILKYETSTSVLPEQPYTAPKPPPGPSIPQTGSVSYGGIVIENDSSTVTLPAWEPPPKPERIDNMGVLSIGFSDGTSVKLPPISDSTGFNGYQYQLDSVGQGKTIVSLAIDNDNTNRDVLIKNVQVFDPGALGGVKPLNAVSTAQDAIVSMEGIEVRRPTNEISDLVPGLTLNVLGASDKPVSLSVEPDRNAVKEGIIGLVGNYNRLMAEINVLTRSDTRVIDELTYLTKEEKDDYKKMLGAFSGDSTLMQIRNSLMRIVSTPYPTSDERDLALLSQIGIGTDVRKGGVSGGYDASRLRGYLEIDEKALDTAIAARLPAIKQLFGSDTTGDLLVDTGIAFSIDALAKPYTETNGLLALKTGTIDTRIDQQKRRIDTLDRQLALKEADLKKQYGQMESAYKRMESMSASLNRFQQSNGSGDR